MKRFNKTQYWSYFDRLREVSDWETVIKAHNQLVGIWPEDRYIINNGLDLHNTARRHEQQKKQFKEIINFYTGWRK